MLEVNHKIHLNEHRRVGMLLPHGYCLHKGLLSAKNGDIVQCYDGLAAIRNMEIVKAKSKYAEMLSDLIYGEKLDITLKAMRGNWGREMEEETLIFLIVERV